MSDHKGGRMFRPSRVKSMLPYIKTDQPEVREYVPPPEIQIKPKEDKPISDN